MSRALAFAAAFVIALVVPSAPSAADAIAVTSGHASLYWDASLTSAVISSADSRFSSEYHASPSQSHAADGSVDFSTAIPFTNAGNRPLSQTYRGQTFSAWLTGSMAIRTRSIFFADVTSEGATRSFTTTFTMTGVVSGYATSDRTGTPLFVADVIGQGTYTAGPYRAIDGAWIRERVGANVMAFESAGIAPRP